MNGRPLSEAHKHDMTSILKHTALESSKAQTKRLSGLDMFRHGLATRTLILMSNWVCGIVMAYVLVLNVSDLSGDIFANFFLSSFIAAVGTIVANVLIKILGKSNRLFPPASLSF